MSSVVLRQLTIAIAHTLDVLLTAYFWILIASVVLSWVNPDPYNPIVRFVRSVTEPLLRQIRRRAPFVVAAGIDFSPLVVVLGIQLVRTVVVQSLYELAFRIAAAAAGTLVG